MTTLQILINQIKTTPIELQKSVGAIYLFTAVQFLLSVGAFFERPRANTVRPYRALYNFSDKDITLLQLCLFLFI